MFHFAQNHFFSRKIYSLLKSFVFMITITSWKMYGLGLPCFLYNTVKLQFYYWQSRQGRSGGTGLLAVHWSLAIASLVLSAKRKCEDLRRSYCSFIILRVWLKLLSILSLMCRKFVVRSAKSSSANLKKFILWSLKQSSLSHFFTHSLVATCTPRSHTFLFIILSKSITSPVNTWHTNIRRLKLYVITLPF